MKKPLIAITPSHNTENDDISMRPTYLRAVAAAGGLPVVLPLEGTEEDIAQYVDTCDGFLFSGGPDLHPFLFGEDTHQNCGNVSAARDTMEQQLFKLAFKARKPILGICRGIQEINVFLGGDIYQDLPSQYEAAFPIAHRQPYYYTTTSHLVDIVPGTRMAEIAGGKAQIAAYLFIYYFAFQYIGYTIPTFLLIMATSVTLGYRKWKVLIPAAVFVSIGLYLAFTQVFNIRFMGMFF